MKHAKGSILILSLWVLSFLTIFAVQIGLQIRQRIMLVSRMEERSQLRLIADAGIKKGIALLRQGFMSDGARYTSEMKIALHNNRDLFKDIRVGAGSFSVLYGPQEEEKELSSSTSYGLVDEERKININAADAATLTRLMQRVLGGQDQTASEIAEAIVDWREPGIRQPQGFYSDAYYSNLQFPYQPKDGYFELIDELLLLKGISPEVFYQLREYLTIYGDGRVNINTASEHVLYALGMNDSLINKLVSLRQGPDGREGTTDDFIFERVHDLASDLLKSVQLEVDEIKQIDLLNSAARLKTSSRFFSIQSSSRLDNSRLSDTVWAVYDTYWNRIEYWREK